MTKANHLRAIFPGSFDPFTFGHLDIVERALGIFERVTVGVLENPQKAGLFTAEERVMLIKRLLHRYGSRVEVASFSGLLVEYAKSRGAHVILRGLRAISDYDYEAQMALVNRRLDPRIETLFLTTREEYAYISSSVVKQVARYGGDVSEMVPALVVRALEGKIQENKPPSRGKRKKKA